MVYPVSGEPFAAGALHESETWCGAVVAETTGLAGAIGGPVGMALTVGERSDSPWEFVALTW
jgi:hypothetical protein